MQIVGLAVVVLFWGTAFVGIKAVVGTSPPLFGAGMRIAVAAVALLLVMAARRQLRLPVGIRWRVALGGLFMVGIPQAALYWGEQYVTAGLAGIINGTAPIWGFAIGLLFLRRDEAFAARKLVGLLLGLAGVALIFAPQWQLPAGGRAVAGAAAVLCMAISYGIGSVWNRAVLLQYPAVQPQTVMTWQMVSSTVFLLLLSMGLEGDPRALVAPWSATLWWATIYLGLASTAVGFVVYLRLVRDWGVVRAMTITYLVPIVGLLMDFLIYRNVPSVWEAAGVLVIVGSITLLYRAPRPRPYQPAVQAAAA